MAITIADNQGNAIDQNNPLPVDLTTSEAIIPVDIQNHLTQTIQTHNAVSVPLSGWSFDSAYRSSDGFQQICVNVKNDATTNNGVVILWSTDGTNLHGQDIVLATGNGGGYDSTARSGSVDVKAPYYKVGIGNYDSALAHTMSAWAYLRA